MSPYTIMLTTSLEPVYGIVLAYIIIGEKEKMSIGFYIGAIIIFCTIILNSIVKHYKSNK
jgi:drug/metabolite transporter (DMT)-like permease